MTDSFRRIVRTGLAALLEDVPEGPDWSDLTPETTLAPSKQVRFGWLAGVGAAVVVLVVIGVAAFLTGEENPVPPPASETTQPVSPTVFQPPTRTVDGETFLDLTLLDGSQITLAYPADLDLTSRGVEAQAAGGVGAVNRTVETSYGPPEGFIAQNEANQGPGELTDTYTGPDGGRVERWDFPDIPYLVFDFSPWTAYVWDTKVEVGKVAEGWADNLHGTTDANGFLVLTADPPLELVDAADDPGPSGPDIRVDGESGALLVFINDCDRMARLDEEVYGNDVFAFCDEPTNTLFFVGGDAEVQERIHKSLRVNPDDEPTTTTSVTTTTTTLAAQVPAAGPIFGEETGMVLLLDDGLEGLTAVDPDARRAARSPVEGQRPGDEEFSMVRVGERLVVGWANIHVVDIATRQGFSLGSATVFVPSATEDNVWMIDYPGGRIGSGRPTVWQVNTSGETTIAPRELNSDSIPLFGIEGGLALQANDGIDLWDVATGEIRELVGDGPGFAHDVSGDTLAWCNGNCTTLNLTNTSSLTTEDLSAPAGMVFLESGFSDDGRYLAAILADDSSFEGEAVLLLDREAGLETTISGQGAPVQFVAWAPDNDQLFATGYSYGQGVTPVWRYQISSGQFSSVVLPIGGAITPVVIEESQSDAYFDDSDVGF